MSYVVISNCAYAAFVHRANVRATPVHAMRHKMFFLQIGLRGTGLDFSPTKYFVVFLRSWREKKKYLLRNMSKLQGRSSDTHVCFLEVQVCQLQELEVISTRCHELSTSTLRKSRTFVSRSEIWQRVTAHIIKCEFLAQVLANSFFFCSSGMVCSYVVYMTRRRREMVSNTTCPKLPRPTNCFA